MESQKNILEGLYLKIINDDDSWQKEDIVHFAKSLVGLLNSKRDDFELEKLVGVYMCLINAQQSLSEELIHIEEPAICFYVASRNVDSVVPLLQFLTQLKLTENYDAQLYKTLMDRIAHAENTEFANLSVRIILKLNKKNHQLITGTLKDHPNTPFFSQAFVQFLNKAKEEDFLLSMQGIIKIYQKLDEFFYTNDLKVILDIIIRTFQDPYSQACVETSLSCLCMLTCCSTFEALKSYKKTKILQLIEAARDKNNGYCEIVQQIEEAYY